ncbi:MULTISPECIES: histidinol dehydrogenase [Dehalobacter]|jgi:histidinol dehydrogenase|uniref:Histidinol dehydrogenase n=2 Tax=Dehalobacter restrictus TaxID=55583 RepID=A0A857DL73_9FIRM|nr:MULTISPECIES: histidinol dehydrogenase [Dehalobacter]AHF10508.1 histidinol dehydrogenase [Dehalobacter restrictus DSM 9455]MCG1025432.1 histidinol dehydrogenase [Dehalobacter sp.]MDJ0305676.1 histidinol dehydrogenase [Dehalobacter sp.]OCZ51105.1 histidinol dehydrogenase [Dehalobacter sp. TeCB1]QHA01135.1 histidinol dehydrogenase [Dehalobacter restrictus]
MKTVQKIQDIDLKKLINKSYGDNHNLEEKVAGILQKIREQGDEALYDLTAAFDGVDLKGSGLRVTDQEIWEAYKKVDDVYLEAISQAMNNVRTYHEKQKRVSWFDIAEDGSILGQIIRPLQRVGIYVPGGTAAYPSSVLMNALPAAVAGVEEIVMVSPPLKDGSLLPEVLVAAAECGVKEIYKVGGAQAVAALAFGTATIAPVDKITGPGNIFVTLAKKMVYGTVDIDMLAGPSEILILADESAAPEELAADLLSQAEHDRLASAILISPYSDLLEKTVIEVERQLEALPRAEIARASWDTYGAAILVEDLEEGINLVNRIAPEHFELVVQDPFAWLGKVKNAGAVFLGRYTPEPVGDYFAGPNHILPTGGTARFYSVLSVDTFVKRISVINYSEEALQRDAAQIAYLARKEGLEAHARAIEVRQKWR